jgi:hypothetical protein
VSIEIKVHETPSPPRFAVEPVVKLFGLLATLCYLMGFLVVNASLVGLGASELSTLSPRLVFIGAIALALASAPFVFPFAAAWIVQSNKSFGLKALAVAVAGLGFVTLPVLCGVLVGLSDNAFLGTEGRSPTRATAVALGLLASSLVAACAAFRVWLHLMRPTTAGMPAAVAWLAWRLTPTEGATPAPIWMGAAFWALPAVAGLFGYVVLFGRFVYPTLPAQLGGGKPSPVTIVVAKDDVVTLERLHLCRTLTGDADCRRESGRVGILFENDDAYLVRRLPDQALALVKKDIVRAIHVLP